MHPDESASLQCEPEHGCITCGDEAVELRIVKLDEERGLALCESAEGARETVETALVLPVAPGDRLLVHAGTAIARLQEETT
ncbi:MAG TPA: HypC/HybG/HupF family hydrogenase formation chaperone [Thermoleophilaceae bacterium]|nr:HypC/HybG/HupF family hydrogenase formation chaperone [Thermoleophilaceae bacterium]